MRKEILYFERNCDVYLLYKKCYLKYGSTLQMLQDSVYSLCGVGKFFSELNTYKPYGSKGPMNPSNYSKENICSAYRSQKYKEGGSQKSRYNLINFGHKKSNFMFLEKRSLIKQQLPWEAVQFS